MSNITRLIEHLEQLPDAQFDMHNWRHDSGRRGCGTVGCIGGWAEFLAIKDGIPHKLIDGDTLSQRWLGISHRVATELFFCYLASAELRRQGREVSTFDLITKRHAIEALRMIETTGTLDWLRVLGLHSKGSNSPTLVRGDIENIELRVDFSMNDPEAY